MNGTEANYKLGRFLNGAWTPVGRDSGQHRQHYGQHAQQRRYAAYFDGDYTGGEASEFGKVPTFYSRTATAGLAGRGHLDESLRLDLQSPTATDSAPLPTIFPDLANPVVILSGHLINSASAGPRAPLPCRLHGTLDLGANAANNFNTVTWHRHRAHRLGPVSGRQLRRVCGRRAAARSITRGPCSCPPAIRTTT
ncbi:MAG: hypothetical protein WKG07_10975 [Hymenobacter sp.]